MLTARRRHRRERGQTLLIALAFLGLFSLWGVAVLRLAVGTQGTLGAVTAADAGHALAAGPSIFVRSAVAQGAGCDGLMGSVDVGGAVLSFGPMAAHDPAGRPIPCATATPTAGAVPGSYSASGAVSGAASSAGSSVEVGVGPAPGKTLSTRAFNYR